MILSVVGARPQFIKAAVVSRALVDAGIEERVVHTGQHYDEAMSGRFLRELGIVNVIANLACGSGSHAKQTAHMMMRLEELMIEHARRIKAVLVYGDTNSSIAAAMVAAKMSIPVVHVESGLRSFNRSMPEEVNRIVVDHLSSLLFCSSRQGVVQLAREGIENSVVEVGDVMLDAFETFAPGARRVASADFLRGPPFAIVTIHRPSNTDDPERLSRIVAALGAIDLACIWPVHPRLGERMKQVDLPPNIHCVEPLSYFDMLAALESCHCVVTDSGGLQKETYWARKPCITARAETEWVETLEGGWNQLWDPERVSLRRLLERRPKAPWYPLYGDGHASKRIAEHVRKHLFSC